MSRNSRSYAGAALLAAWMSIPAMAQAQSEPEGFREARMVAIEASRRAAERLWREIGQLLVLEAGSAVQAPF